MSEKSELKRTPLYAAHVRAGARMVEFAGWRMPLAYGSQIEEHHAVRRTAGMFDVSHMTVVDVTAPVPGRTFDGSWPTMSASWTAGGGRPRAPPSIRAC